MWYINHVIHDFVGKCKRPLIIMLTIFRIASIIAHRVTFIKSIKPISRPQNDVKFTSNVPLS